MLNTDIGMETVGTGSIRELVDLPLCKQTEFGVSADSETNVKTQTLEPTLFPSPLAYPSITDILFIDQEQDKNNKHMEDEPDYEEIGSNKCVHL